MLYFKTTAYDVFALRQTFPSSFIMKCHWILNESASKTPSTLCRKISPSTGTECDVGPINQPSGPKGLTTKNRYSLHQDLFQILHSILNLEKLRYKTVSVEKSASPNWSILATILHIACAKMLATCDQILEAYNENNYWSITSKMVFQAPKSIKYKH